MQKKMPLLQLRAEFKPGSYNAEKRTIDLVWTTGARGLRSSWFDTYWEELDVSPDAVRMDRLKSGATPFLAAHNSYSLSAVLGVVEDARIEKGEGHATVRFTSREDPAAQGVIQDIIDGVIRNISVGYRVWTYREVESGADKIPVYRAVDWEPMEISAVPIGFDAGAQTRGASAEAPNLYEVQIVPRNATPTPTAAERGTMTEENETMLKNRMRVRSFEDTPDGGGGVPAPAPTPTTDTRTAPDAAEVARQAIEAERTRVSGIVSLVRQAKLGSELGDRLVAEGVSIEAARATVLEELIKREPAAGVSGVRVTRDEQETSRRAMEGALLLRVSPTAKLGKEELEMAGSYRHMSLLRMAEESLILRGESVRGLSGREIAARALNSTSDFPLILAATANKRLRSYYEEAPTTYQVWARRAPNAPDFKQMNVLQIGGAPDLEQVNEGGEFTYGTVGEGSEVYSVVTYGKIVGFTRQAIINDDLRAFDRLLTGFAGAARRLENRLVYKQITTNPTMSDGTALFAAGHGNLAGAGATISAATLGAGRAAMRKQKGYQGEDLNIAPAYLLVPTDLEQLAYQFTSSQYTPTKSSDVNEFRSGGRTALEPIVEPYLDTSSATAWYLVGDGTSCDTVEYCWLDGAEGVYLESEMGFDIDGMKLKARLDFGAKVIDHRALYKNPGS